MPKFKVLVQVREVLTTNLQYTVLADTAIDAARIAQAKSQGEAVQGEPDERATDVDYTVTDIKADEIVEFAEADLEDER